MIREVERFAVLEVYHSEGAAVPEAKVILRLAVGLRRKLDQLKEG